MFVIGVIGSKGAGKDTLAAHISKSFHTGHHSHSEIYHDILKILKLPESRVNLIKLVELRKTFGENILINALNKKLRKDNKEVQVLTGIRFQNELDNIRSYEKNLVIYIDAPIEQRFKWLKERGKYNDDSSGYDEFLRLETEETEKHIQDLGEQADYIIQNTGDLAELFRKTDEILKPILKP